MDFNIENDSSIDADVGWCVNELACNAAGISGLLVSTMVFAIGVKLGGGGGSWAEPPTLFSAPLQFFLPHEPISTLTLTSSHARVSLRLSLF